MVEKYIKSNICPLPWTHLEVDVNGGASPCCLYKGQIPDVKVYEQGLNEIQKKQLKAWQRSGMPLKVVLIPCLPSYRVRKLMQPLEKYLMC